VLLLRIISLILFSSFLFAKTIEVFATKAVESNNTVVLENPVIIYKDFIVQAKKGIIKNKKEAY